MSGLVAITYPPEQNAAQVRQWLAEESSSITHEDGFATYACLRRASKPAGREGVW